MKKLHFYSLCLLLLSSGLILSCNDDTESTIKEHYDCKFVQNDDDMDGQIDETERSLMTECTDNKLTDKEEIEDNLIGEWELIGHGEGWTYTPSQPCAYLVFTKDELTFKFENARVDALTTHTWEIIEHNNNNNTYFELSISPDPEGELFLTTFSKDYMYSDATPVDGNMYLYEKVN